MTAIGAARSSPRSTRSAHTDPRRPAVWTVVKAFLRRDFVTAWSYRLPFVMELATTGFMLTLFFFLARVVDTGTIESFRGMESGYFPFVVVGLAVFRMLQTALTTFTTMIRQEQTAGTLEALLATPTSPALVVLASSSYALVRAVVSATVMILLALLVGLELDVSWLSGLAALLNVLASVVLFAAVGIAIAAFTMVFKQAGGVVGLVTAGVSLLGGVYFPVEVFPGWLQVVARALPFTWSVDLLRAQLLRAEAAWPLLAIEAAVAGVLLVLALHLFRRATDHARRTGGLGNY